MARTIVVTGGSAGIGLAVTKRFAEDGWQVAIIARHEAQLEQASAMLTAAGASKVLPGPLFDPRLCGEAVERPQREFWVGRSTMMMALGQSLAPEIADRHVAKQIDAMTGNPAPNRAGNLDEPGEGPAAINGPSTDRVWSSRHEIFSSRQRDLLKVGAAGFGLGRLLPHLLP